MQALQDEVFFFLQAGARLSVPISCTHVPLHGLALLLDVFADEILPGSSSHQPSQGSSSRGGRARTPANTSRVRRWRPAMRSSPSKTTAHAKYRSMDCKDLSKRFTKLCMAARRRNVLMCTLLAHERHQEYKHPASMMVSSVLLFFCAWLLIS